MTTISSQEAAPPTDAAADVIFKNGTVVTLDEQSQIAQALAVRGNEIIAVGTAEHVMAHQGAATRIVDLAGASLYPGINDAHVHVMPVGFMMIQMDLNGKPLDAIREELKGEVAQKPAGMLIKGTGWSEPALGRMPTKADLDDISPDHPVVLTDMSHHAVLLNTKALEMVGFDAATPNDDGVTFVRLEGSDELSGVILEGYTLVNEKLPQPRLQDRKDAIQRAVGMLNAQGITSVTEPGLTVDEVEAYRALAAEGGLTARACAHLWAGASLQEAHDAIGKLPDGVSAKGAGTTESLFTLRINL